MEKKGIFIKIYLSFWLFTVLIVLSQFAFDWLSQSGPRGPFHNFHDKIIGAYASNIIKLNSPAASLKNMEPAVLDSDEIEIFIVDEKINEISGKTLSDGAKQVSARALQSPRPERININGKRYFAKSIIGPDGQKYAVAHHVKFEEPAAGETNRLILRVLIILLISAGVCYGLASYISSPILTLREAAQRFSDGELDHRVGAAITGRKDEFRELAYAFNQMAEKIESLMVQQRKLLGDISHELRSPLARMGVALELARGQSGEAAVKSLNRIETEAATLNSLIGEVISLTRLESGIEAERFSPLNLGTLIKKLADDADFEARGSSKKVILTGCGDIMVTGSENLLKRAIENVIRNAVKYGPENTVIEVNLLKNETEKGGRAEIKVSDRGCGVAENELSNIFDPFYRTSNARERKTGGSGLGLSITRRAVLLHKGVVYAQNREDGGLIVTIDLPAV